MPLDRFEHGRPRLGLRLGDRRLGWAGTATSAAGWAGTPTSAAGGAAPAPPAVAAAIASCGATPYFGRTTPVTELGE